MILHHVKRIMCPLCKCTQIVRESIDHYDGSVRIHCNGQRWETRTFLCGCEASWIPNFSKEFVKGCTNTQEYREKQLKRQSIQKEITRLQNELMSF